MTFLPWARRIAVRLAVVITGVVLVALGWYAWSHEIFWVTVFSPRFGRFGFMPTLTFVILGVLIILAALFFPAQKGIPSKEEKRHERKHLQWMKREKYQKHYPPD